MMYVSLCPSLGTDKANFRGLCNGLHGHILLQGERTNKVVLNKGTVKIKETTVLWEKFVYIIKSKCL